MTSPSNHHRKSPYKTKTVTIIAVTIEICKWRCALAFKHSNSFHLDKIPKAPPHCALPAPHLLTNNNNKSVFISLQLPQKKNKMANPPLRNGCIFYNRVNGRIFFFFFFFFFWSFCSDSHPAIFQIEMIGDRRRLGLVRYQSNIKDPMKSVRLKRAVNRTNGSTA